jgi:hypothetical protein
MITNGALSHSPDTGDSIQPGRRYTTWVRQRKRMRDTEFVATSNPNVVAFDGYPGDKLQLDVNPLPVREIPADTPHERGGAPLDSSIEDRLRNLPGYKTLWHKEYARQCLSPVVIVGDGREYLQNQREELIEEVPLWFGEEQRALLSEDSHQTSNPERTYFHPFMVFSPQVGNTLPWLRAMKPRLVIVTSWSAHRRMHPSLFAGAPHIILTNRRVKSAVAAADFLDQDTTRGADAPVPTPPHGIFVRTFEHQVLVDSAELRDDDEWSDEL